MKRFLAILWFLSLTIAQASAFSEENLKGAKFCLYNDRPSRNTPLKTGFDKSVGIDNEALGMRISGEIVKKLTLYRIPFQKLPDCLNYDDFVAVIAYGGNTLKSGLFVYSIRITVSNLDTAKYPGLVDIFSTSERIGFGDVNDVNISDTIFRKVSDEIDELALEYIRQN